MVKAVSVFGLGYVGTVVVGCLADHDFKVVGVDTSPDKVDALQRGISPVVEEGLTALIAKGREKGLIHATTDPGEAVRDSSVSVVCVGTPSNSNGSLNTRAVERVCEQIGGALRGKGAYHTVVIRSTILPGTTEKLVIPSLEAASGKRAGHDFGVSFSPEFLREGQSIEDFYHPPYIVIGAAESDPRAVEEVSGLYGMVDAPVHVVPFKVAEMIKYASNAFHALKVAFGNEMGNLCKEHGVDSHRVMDLFCRDVKLNISGKYLMPGFAFGGSCLPKDLRALMYDSRQFDLTLPVIESILASNQRQIDVAYRMIRERGKRKIGVLGISFKAGTDDLRESPVVALLEYLIGKGYSVRVYDRNISLARLRGANQAFIEREIPYIAELLVGSVEEVLGWGEVVLVGNRSEEFLDVMGRLRPGQTLVDLVRIDRSLRSGDNYLGICW